MSEEFHVKSVTNAFSIRHISPRFTIKADIDLGDGLTARTLLTETDLEITDELDQTLMAELGVSAYLVRVRR